MRVIAGDIGGTKVLLQLSEVHGDDLKVVREERFDSKAYDTFDALLEAFLRGVTGVDAACFAVAGPVHRGRAEITNLRWVMEREALEQKFGIGRVVLQNDFYGVAVAVPHLAENDLLPINKVPRQLDAPVSTIAILGAGTGLGEAILVRIEGQWRVISSEGGHATFAPRNARQRALQEHLEKQFGHVSYERLLSGQGLVNIFTFLREHEFKSEAGKREPEHVSAAEISELAKAGNPLAVKTFEMFIDVYGGEAGNLALKVLPYGGVYIAGGVAAKNAQFFTSGRFMRAFADKGRFSDDLMKFPIDVVTNPRVGVIGAAIIARNALKHVLMHEGKFEGQED